MNNYLGQAPVFGDFPFQILSGDGTASYNLNYQVSNENGMLVFLNGAIQRPGVDFTAGGTSLVFSETVAIGVQIFTYGMGLPKSTLAPSAGSVGDAELSASLKLNRISQPFSKLRLSSTGTNALVSVTANHIALLDDSFNQKVVQSVNLPAINLASSGVNGLDTGTSVASTWYSVWVIWNPTTSTVAGLLSIQETNPTMPDGFTFKKRVGWVRSDASANKFPFPFSQLDEKVVYAPNSGTNMTANPLPLSGGASTTLTPISLSGVVPPTVVKTVLAGIMSGTTSAQGSVYRNNNTSSLYLAAFNSNGAATSREQFEVVGDTYQTPVYYSVSSGSLSIVVMGWEDSI